MTPAMIDQAACGFCGTAIAEVAPRKHVEKVVDAKVDAKVDAVRASLKADLQRDLRRDLQRDLARQEPSVAVVATQEVARYTAAKVWGCGAGCLSTLGSLAVTLLIIAVVAAANLAPHLGPLIDKYTAPTAEEPAKPPPHKKKR